MDANWIDEKIFWLTGVFFIDDSLFFSNFDATPEIYKYFESSTTRDIRKAVEIISGKLGFIACPFIQYDWDGNIDDNKARGVIGGGKIVISMMNVGDKYALSATTIHELMHYALIHEKKITLPDEKENEKITDLAAIVLGFGKIILNGKVLTNKYVTTTLGVLTPEETAYAYKKICSLRSINDLRYLNDSALNILGGNSTKTKCFNDGTSNISESNPESNLIKNNFFPHVDFSAKRTFLIFVFMLGVMVIFSVGKPLVALASIAGLVLFSILAYQIVKKTTPFIRSLYLDKINKNKKKKCPFCKKDIPKETDTCPKCKRVLREKWG